MNPATLPLTDRARRVLKRAEAERDRLGHHVLTPQHLAWALVAEKGSIARSVLEGLAFDPWLLERQLGPDWHATGPGKAGDENPLVAADESARALGHSCVDTAHLLLGILRRENRVSKFLRAQGVTYAAAAEATDRLWTRAVG